MTASTPPPAAELPPHLIRLEHWRSHWSTLSADAPPIARWDAFWWSRCHRSISEFLASHQARIAVESGWSTLELFAVERATGKPHGVLLLDDQKITQVAAVLVRRIDGRAWLRADLRLAADEAIPVWEREP